MKKLPSLLATCALLATPAYATESLEGEIIAWAKESMGCDITAKKPQKPLGTCLEEASKNLCSTYGALPVELQAKIGLEMHCDFLAAQMKDDVEENKKTAQKMDDLGCIFNDHFSMQMLRKYWKKEKEMHALLFFAESRTDAIEKCEKTDPKPAVKVEDKEQPAKEEAKKEETQKEDDKPEGTKAQ